MERPDLIALTLRNELLPFLKSLNDADTNIDTGGGLGAEDIVLTYQGHRVRIQLHWPEPAPPLSTKRQRG